MKKKIPRKQRLSKNSRQVTSGAMRKTRRRRETIARKFVRAMKASVTLTVEGL